MIFKSILATLFLLLGSLADATEQPIRNPTRGELLYSTYCDACHNTQVHWRDKRLSTNWTSLLAEVNRWQEIAGLGWDKEDVARVARYLNHLYYKFPTPE
jgi:hypothetical protein